MSEHDPEESPATDINPPPDPTPDLTPDTTPEGQGSDNDAVESAPGVIGDDQLPEDLRPTDDNPLAKNPDPDVDPNAPAET